MVFSTQNVFVSTGHSLSEDQQCSYAVMLLAFGADATRKGLDGMSVVEHAEWRGQAMLAHYLQHWGGRHIEMLRRTSSTLSRLTSVRAAVCTKHLESRPKARQGHDTAGQVTPAFFQKVLLVRICDMLA